MHCPIRLRIDLFNVRAERYGFAHVIERAYPRNRAFDAHAEARVRHAAIAAQVEIPLECFFRQIMLAGCAAQQF